MKVYSEYSMEQSTLFLTLNAVNRYLKAVSSLVDFSKLTNGNLEEFKLASLIILNLASKYNERVAYKISDLASKVDVSLMGINLIDDNQQPNSELLRKYEFEVLKALDFKLRPNEE